MVIATPGAGLGDDDQAFEWLDRAVNDLSLYGYIMYPLFAELQADPRFAQYRQRLEARGGTLLPPPRRAGERAHD